MIQLTIQEKIKVLEEAKKLHLSPSFNDGICVAIVSKLNELHNIECSTLEVSYYIHNMTKEHVCEMTKGTKLYPTDSQLYYWWNLKDKNTRTEVYDLLINELKI